MKRILVLTLMFGLLAGCSGTPTGKGKQAKYTFNGLAELNLDDGLDYLYVEFLTDGKAVPGSFLRLGNDTLYFSQAGWVIAVTPEVSWTLGENVAITVQDTAAGFSRTIIARMPGSFQIQDFAYAFAPYSHGSVPVDWSGSAGAKGYFVTCVQRQAGGEARGYASTTGITGATIDPQTFQHRVYQDRRIIDSFYVFVIAYHPTYYPRFGPKYLDTPEFDKLDFPASALGTDLAGRFGAAVVGVRAPFAVVAQE